MQNTTHAIIIKKINYKDKRTIVVAYTQALGIHSFLFYSSSKIKKGHLMPLNQVEISYYTKGSNTDEISIIKDIKSIAPYLSVYTHVYKSAQLIFINEVLDKTLKEHQPDNSAFVYLTDMLINLDKQGYNPWFHLFFLVDYMSYLGIKPDITNLKDAAYFDLEQGVFTHSQPAHFINGNNLNCFVELINNNLKKEHNTIRKNMLAYLLKYYQLHVPGFNHIKSAEVLNEVLV